MNWIVTSALSAAAIALIFSGAFFSVYKRERKSRDAMLWSAGFFQLALVLSLVAFRSSPLSLNAVAETHLLCVLATFAMGLVFLAVSYWRGLSIRINVMLILLMAIPLGISAPALLGFDTAPAAIRVVRVTIGALALAACFTIWFTRAPRNIAHHAMAILMALIGMALIGSLFLLQKQGFSPDAGMFTSEQFRSHPVTLLTIAAWPVAFSVAGMMYMLAVTLERVNVAQKESARDPLTQLLNRRGFQSRMERQMERGPDSALPVAMLAIDLDHFKSVNDTYGHDVGDAVIVRFADVLRQNTRPTDLVARFGGEEFIVMLQASTVADAEKVVARIQDSMAREGIIAGGKRISVTASFGAAATHDVNDLGQLFERADRALYQAKRDGRDRLVDFDRLDVATR